MSLFNTVVELALLSFASLHSGYCLYIRNVEWLKLNANMCVCSRILHCDFNGFTSQCHTANGARLLASASHILHFIVTSNDFFFSFYPLFNPSLYRLQIDFFSSSSSIHHQLASFLNHQMNIIIRVRFFCLFCNLLHTSLFYLFLATSW